MAPGAVFLAAKLRMPLVVIAMGYDRPWRAHSWDRFAVPRPFSRARAIIGPQMHIPQGLDRDGLEHYRLEAERMLNRLTFEAEAWAESGLRRAEGRTLKRQQARGHLRQDAAHCASSTRIFSRPSTWATGKNAENASPPERFV